MREMVPGRLWPVWLGFDQMGSPGLSGAQWAALEVGHTREG